MAWWHTHSGCTNTRTVHHVVLIDFFVNKQNGIQVVIESRSATSFSVLGCLPVQGPSIRQSLVIYDRLSLNTQMMTGNACPSVCFLVCSTHPRLSAAPWHLAQNPEARWKYFPLRGDRLRFSPPSWGRVTSCVVRRLLQSILNYCPTASK